MSDYYLNQYTPWSTAGSGRMDLGENDEEHLSYIVDEPMRLEDFDDLYQESFPIQSQPDLGDSFSSIEAKQGSIDGDDSRARGQRRQHPEHRQDAIHRHNPNIPPGSSNLDYRSRALISEIGKYEKALLHIPDRPSSSKSKKNKNKPNEASSRPSSSKNRPRNNDNNKYKDKSGRRRHEGSSKCQDSL